MSRIAGDGSTGFSAGTPRFRPREAISVLVHSAGQWQKGRLLNLSARGAFVSVAADMWPGEEVSLILDLPPGERGRIELRARVVWRSAGKPAHGTSGYGFFFLPEPDADSLVSSAIQSLVAQSLLVQEREDGV